MAFPKAGYDARKSPGKFKANACARLTRPTGLLFFEAYKINNKTIK